MSSNIENRTTVEIEESEFLIELEHITNSFENQYNKFIIATEGENYFQIILRAHLYIEHELTEIIRKYFKHPEEIIRQLNFSRKLGVLLALGEISQDLKAPINHLNRLRNKYAHELDYQFSEQDFNDFLDTFKPEFKMKYLVNITGDISLSNKLRGTLASIWYILIEDRLIDKDVVLELEKTFVRTK